MKYILGLYVCLMYLTSCSFKGSFGGLTSNYSQSHSQQPGLFTVVGPEENICTIDAGKPPQVYVIQATPLRQCLHEYEKALVYIWKPNCSSEKCYALSYYQRICDSLNMELFVVAEYFDADKMALDHPITHPVLGIDINYYRSNFTSKYLSRFLTELIANPEQQQRQAYYFFKKGLFIAATNDLEAIYRY